MISRSVIKSNAKEQLGGNIFGSKWMMALLLLFIEEAIIALGTYTGVVSLLCTGPLVYGITFAFVKLMRSGTDMELGDLFKGFSNDFGRNFLLALMQEIFIVLWSLLFVIPGIIKTYSYSMAFYVAHDHPEYSWNDCIKTSMKMTKGHKGELFVLDLSFIGWYIVGIICLGVGTLWVAPYHQMAKINYYEAIAAEYMNGGNQENTAYQQ